MLSHNDIWDKILEFSHTNKGKTLKILNPDKPSHFIITKVMDDYIRVNKHSLKMTRTIFLTIYDYIKSKKRWVKIGARRVGAKPDTIEGLIKLKFYDGKMDYTSTATWFAAILVHSSIGIEFNGKALNQQLRIKN